MAITTQAIGEEDSLMASPSTMLTGEEGGGDPTTMRTGEEDSLMAPSTMATGEEGGGEPTTMATGEEDPRLFGASVSDPFGEF